METPTRGSIMRSIATASANVEMRGKAVEFARFGIALAIAKGDGMHAAEIFQKRWPNSINRDLIVKAAIAAGNTTDATWAGPLAEMNTLGAAFVEYLRPLTVIGRMSGFRPVPFNIRFPRATAGASVGWVGQGRVTPVLKMTFESLTFGESKIAGIIVLTSELARSADPAAESLVRADMAAAIAQFSDQSFLDPALAEVTDVSPASVLYGAPEIVSSGVTVAAIAEDLRQLFAAVTTNLSAPYLIMKPSTAAFLASIDTGGGPFRNVGPLGGDIWGTPVLTSGNMPADANSPSNGMIALIDAAEIILADDGITFDASGNATIEMSSTPDSPPTASTTLTSLWAENLLALKTTRYVRWKKRRDDAAAYISGVAY